MKHFLIVYQRRTGTLLTFSELASEDPSEALKKRFQMERQERADPDVEVVILSAPSVEALKRTHARYFKTSAELAASSYTAPS